MKVERRYANRDWDVADSQGDVYTSMRNGKLLAVAMDIRYELQRLNSLLYCENFTRIPTTLKMISRNTAKPKVKK